MSYNEHRGLAPPRCDVVKNSPLEKVQPDQARIFIFYRCAFSVVEKVEIRDWALALGWTFSRGEFRHQQTTRRRKPPMFVNTISRYQRRFCEAELQNAADSGVLTAEAYPACIFKSRYPSCNHSF